VELLNLYFSSDIYRMTNQDRVDGVCSADWRDQEYEHTFVREPEWKRPLGRSENRRHDIKSSVEEIRE
jgi:hypothetical protein